MIELVNMKWAFPWAFAGLLLLIGVIIWWLSYRSHAQRVGVPGPVDKRLYASWRTRLLPVLPILFFTSLVLGIIALANPRKIDELKDIKSEGIDIFLVIDLSRSMRQQDFKPSRIAVAKEVAKEFVKMRENDRIGLVPFGKVAFTQCPLTMDHKIVLQLIDKMKLGMLGDNTAIGMGLATAVNRLKDSKAESKVIILLTDGVNNVNEITPIQAAELAAQFNIKVYTIGMSKVNNSPFLNRRSLLHRLNVDEQELKEIARITGGNYYRATSREVLENIYKEIDKLETTEMEVTLIKKADLKYRYFLIPALIFLFIWFLASRTFLKTFLP